MSTPPHIRIEGVTKIYPLSGGNGMLSSLTAIDGVSLAIENGERVGVIGANGAGKSTLLQIIAGVNPATSGRVDINGRVHAVLTVGLGLREDATGRENLYLDGAVEGRSRSEVDARIDAMIAFAELGEFIDRPLRTYSSGMKARLAFASLVFIEPEILIVDEAFGVGDAHFVGKSTRVMKDLCKRGKIVIVVSHGMALINDMCERCIWLDQGRIRMDGPAGQVTESYEAWIRKRQEAEMLKRFGNQERTWSVRPGLEMGALKLVDEGSGEEARVISNDQQVILCIDIALARPLPLPGLRAWAERADGLVLFDETMPLGKPDELLAGDLRIEVPLGTIAWRPSLYQVQLQILSDTSVEGHAAVTFKVTSTRAIVGGAPVLETEPTINSIALS